MKHGSSQTGKIPIFRERLAHLQGDMTITAFADKLGLSRQTVGFYLNGDRIPDALTLKEIALACDVSSDYLLGISDTRSQDIDVKCMTENLGLPEYIVEDLISWQHIDQIVKSRCALTEAQNQIIDTINKLYPVTEDNMVLAMDDFNLLISLLLEAVIGRASSVLSQFVPARLALTNNEEPRIEDKAKWVEAHDVLESSGFVALPADDVGEWHLDKMFRTIKEYVQDGVKRFG